MGACGSVRQAQQRDARIGPCCRAHLRIKVAVLLIIAAVLLHLLLLAAVDRRGGDYSQGHGFFWGGGSLSLQPWLMQGSMAWHCNAMDALDEAAAAHRVPSGAISSAGSSTVLKSKFSGDTHSSMRRFTGQGRAQ